MALKAALALVIPLYACASSDERRWAPWPDSEAWLGFLVAFDDEGRLSKTLGPLDLATASAERPPLYLDLSEGDRVFFLGWPESAVLGLDPSVDTSNPMSIGLEPSSESCVEGRILPGGNQVRAPLPASTLVFELTEDRFESRQRRDLPAQDFALTAPLKDLDCGATISGLLPFGDAAHLVVAPPHETSEPFRVRRLNRDWAVAASKQAVYLFERGAPHRGATHEWFLVDDAGRFGDWVTDVELAPGTATTATCRDILVTTQNDVKGQMGREPGGALVELTACPSGLSRPRELIRHTGALKGVAVMQDEKVYVVGERRTVFVPGSENPFELRMAAGVSNGYSYLAGSGAPGFPHVLGGWGYVFEGNVEQPQDLREIPLLEDGEIPSDAEVYDVIPVASQLYASTNRSGLYRRSLRGSWDRIDFEMPRAQPVCSRPSTCGRAQLPERLKAIAEIEADGESHLVMSFDHCSRIFTRRESDGCVAIHQLPASVGPDYLGGIDVWENLITVTGEYGLYEAVIDP